jgi:D-alanyl-D-alanine carboxypeptidase
VDINRIGAVALSLSLLGAAPADPLGDAVTKVMSKTQIPGAQVFVIDHGRVVASRSFGVRDVVTKAPVDDHTRFEIGSITKQLTAAAILQLKERGKLKLTDRLGMYVPEYTAAKDVTIEQLLRQVSGIPEYLQVPAFQALIFLDGGVKTIREPGDFSKILALVRDKPLSFAPGTKWEYSSTNFELLGRIVEIASGAPWNAYIRANIFKPAGMTESAFMEDEAGIADFASGYAVAKDGNLIPTRSFNGWASAAGAIVSTATDVAKWDAALMGGKLLSRADLAAMLRPGVLSGGKAKTHYGYGWFVDTFDNQARVFHNGATLGFTASNQIYPALSQAVIVLENNKSNADSADGVARAVFNALHPALAHAALPKAAADEDPAVTKRAKRVWDALMSGAPDRSEFTASFNAELTPDAVRGATAEFKVMGTPTAWSYGGKTVTSNGTSYVYRPVFADGTHVTVTMEVTADGKLAGYDATVAD